MTRYEADFVTLVVTMRGIWWLIDADLRMPSLERGTAHPGHDVDRERHVEDKVSGLALGADDYLAKPFAFAELVARVRASAGAPRRRSAVLSRATSSSTRRAAPSRGPAR